jgi:hypothetical protein
VRNRLVLQPRSTSDRSNRLMMQVRTNGTGKDLRSQFGGEKEPLRRPRANRYFLAWSHLAHQKQFLLKFTRDRRGYLYWLLEATKRFGLCVLDYTVTSNHVHLLLKSSDT